MVPPEPGSARAGDRDAGAVSSPQPGAEARELFLRALTDLIGPAGFERYFSRGVASEFRDGVLELSAPNAVLAALLEKRFGPALQRVAQEIFGAGSSVRVVFRVAEETGGQIKVPVSPAPVTVRERDARRVAVAKSRYRLEDFIVGDSNRLAYNAAVRAAESGAEARLAGPLFLHGPCGVGKTHLLQGIAQRYRELHPGANVRVTSGEAFMNEFVGAIRAAGERGNGNGASVERFRKQYRRCDLLCIDDVHFLTSKQATQDELLHTFDEIEAGGAVVVLVSDEHPRQLRKFSPALVSRFMSGMVAGVQAPDATLREKLVRLFAARRGLVLEDAAVRAVVERTCGGVARAGQGAPPTVREIEGIVTKLDAVVRLLPQYVAADGKVGVLAVERAMAPAEDAEGAGATRPVRPVRIDQIISYTCAALNVEAADLSGRTRHKRVVLARALITHLARALTTQSYPEIARAIGRPSHSTVITAHQRLQQQLAREHVVELGPSGEPVSLASVIRRLTDSIARAARA